jgi:hypothetical protein
MANIEIEIGIEKTPQYDQSFLCSCGHQGTADIIAYYTHQLRILNWTKILFHSCANCSVHFSDPIAYSYANRQSQT